MKILFLTRLYLPHIGGVELHIKNLIEETKGRHSYVIITEQYDPSLPLFEKKQGVEIWRIPLPRAQTNKFAIWKWLAVHKNLFIHADIVHIHDVFFWILPFLPLLFLKKLFITFHGYEGHIAPRKIQRFWHQLASWCTRGNICIGGFHTKWYGVQPTAISYGAVAQDIIHSTALQKIKSEKKIRILYVGRLAADAGILTYLEGIRMYLQSNITPIHLDVFGDGPQMNKAKSLVENYSLPVTFHGFVPQNKIQWSTYDVAFVSRHLSILEALALGIPVVAHADQPIKEDYLKLSPFTNWIHVVHTAEDIEKTLSRKDLAPPKESQQWAKNQTWKEMARLYEQLWAH